MEDHEESKRRIRNSFLRAFSGDDGVIVLRELSQFTGADNADFICDSRKSDYMQGRRSVFLEIQNIIKERKDERIQS